MNHPFYRKWQTGKVWRETLRDYAAQYYHYEKSLPNYLETAADHLDGDERADSVQRVAEDEKSHPKPHSELWLQFARGLGLSDEEVKATPATPKTRNLVSTYESLAGRGAEEALGAIYAYESQFSEVAGAKADGLRDFYKVTGSDELEFFDVHRQMDLQHAEALGSALPESGRALEAAKLAIEAWWGMLDQFVENGSRESGEPTQEEASA